MQQMGGWPSNSFAVLSISLGPIRSKFSLPFVRSWHEDNRHDQEFPQNGCMDSCRTLGSIQCQKQRWGKLKMAGKDTEWGVGRVWWFSGKPEVTREVWLKWWWGFGVCESWAQRKTQPHRLYPVQCRTESTLPQMSNQPPICFGLPGWKPKAFSSTFPLHLEYASSSCYVPLWSWYEPHTSQALQMKRWSGTFPFLRWPLLLLWASEGR